MTAASLNGTPLSRSYLTHSEIERGDELVLTLGPKAGAGWGVAPGDRPSASGGGESVVPAPFVRSDGSIFRDRLTVELATAEPGSTIRYRLDPEGAWQLYQRPVVLHDSTTIRFVAEHDGRMSPTVEAYFHRIPHDWSIAVASVPNPQYTAGGPAALIDGLRGGKDWRIGGWQGYQYTDFEAMVDLGEVRPISLVGASSAGRSVLDLDTGGGRGDGVP